MGKRENDDDQSMRQVISEQDIKLLFVTQKDQALLPTFRFLKKRNWNYAVVGSMKDAFDLIAKEKPTHVFMSFHLPVQHKRMEQLLKNTFGIIPIIYSETFESTTYSQMRKTGCENIILSPVSGPTVQMKVRNTSQILERLVVAGGKSTKNKKNQNFEEVIDEGPQIPCTINELPGGGFWQQVPEKEPPVWRLSTFLECKLGEVIGIFYFQGKHPPTFNENGVWTVNDDQGSFYFCAKTVRNAKKKKNWWDNAEHVANDKADTKSTVFKYLIEQSKESEDEDQLIKERNSRLIHVKGSKAPLGQKEKSWPKAADDSKITIREAKFGDRGDMILKVYTPEFASYKPVDEFGKTHPFFELDPELNQEGVELSNPEDILMQRDALPSKTYDDGSKIGEDNDSGLFISKGTRKKRKRGAPAERGSVTDSAFFKGQGDEEEKPGQYSYRRKKKPHHYHDNPGDEDEKSAYQEQDTSDDEGTFSSASESEEDPKFSQEEEVFPSQFIQTDDDEDGRGQSLTPEERDAASGVRRKNKNDWSGQDVTEESEDEVASQLDEALQKSEERRKERERTARILGRKPKSILAESSIKTLEEMSAPAPILNRIKNTERVGIIPVKTQGNKGILMIALGDNQKISKNVLSEIRTKLFHHLKMRGQDPLETLDLSIQIDQVDFVSWCSDEMEFIALDRVGPDEVGVAYLPGDDIIPEILDSAQDHMVAVELKCIQAQMTITFDIYIWMNENKKYVRYVKAGSNIAQSQIDKLIKFKTEFFHIKREDMDLFKGYCAANYINVKIRDSKIKKAS